MTVASIQAIGSTLTLGSDGWRDSVHYIVTGAASRKAALDEVGVPHGALHPELPILALDFSVTNEQGDRAYRVVVGYRRLDPASTSDDPPDPTPSGGTRQIGARVQPAVFTRDRQGAQLVTSHTYNQADRVGPVTQPGSVDGFVPTTVLTVTRTENSSPQALAQSFVGKVNSGKFENGAARTWLCTAIEGISDDGGVTYQVTYEFEYRAAKWDAELVFIDEKTDLPISPLVSGQSLRTYQIYDITNFTSLNL